MSAQHHAALFSLVKQQHDERLMLLYMDANNIPLTLTPEQYGAAWVPDFIRDITQLMHYLIAHINETLAVKGTRPRKETVIPCHPSGSVIQIQ
jgi:hypothetical protein